MNLVSRATKPPIRRLHAAAFSALIRAPHRPDLWIGGAAGRALPGFAL